MTGIEIIPRPGNGSLLGTLGHDDLEKFENTGARDRFHFEERVEERQAGRRRSRKCVSVLREEEGSKEEGPVGIFLLFGCYV